MNETAVRSQWVGWRIQSLFLAALLSVSGLSVPLCVATAQSQDDLARVLAHESARIAAFERAARSVVCIFADEQRSGGGSGVVINADGFGLTNFHVVASFLDSRRGFGGMIDGVLYPLTVVGIDPGGDIAMFKLEGKPRFDFAPLGDSDQLYIGQWVAAMGNPFVLAEDFSPTVTVGVISGLHRYQEGQENALEYADCIQVSTSINPGNSGGPLFDLHGRVIGINGRASFEERGRVNVGLGYAVSINQVRRFLPCLYAGQLCPHGTLGATVQQAGPTLLFNQVQIEGPADRAGVRVSDEIVHLGGQPVRTPNEFNNLLAILPAEWPLQLTLRREGIEQTVTARLERLPIRMPRPWVVDWKYNHSQVRRLWSEIRAQLQFSATDQAPDTFEADLSATRDGRSERTALRIKVRDGGSGVEIQTLGTEISADISHLADALRPGDPDSRRIWAEWLALARPLLSDPEIGAGWELRGGDEWEGAIVWVVEYRGAGRTRIRWYLDFETGVLCGGAIADETGVEQARWRILETISVGAGRFPARWQRMRDTEEWLLNIRSARAADRASSDETER